MDQVEVPTGLNEGEERHAFVKLLAISGDGRTIITAGQATLICVWRVEEMGAAAAQAVSPVSALVQSSPASIARRVAERVKLRGGLTDIRFVGRDGGTRIHPNMPIPSEPFYVTRIEIRKRDNMNTDDMQLFADLKNLPELTSLNLGGFKLMANGLSAVAALPQLETLDLNRSTIRDTDLKSLIELRSLTTLDLISTDVADEGLKTLGAMSQLSSLFLKNTRITDEGIAHLVGLYQMRYLILTNTRLTEASVQHLKQFSKLRWLYINDTGISAEGIAELKAALPKCKIYTVPPPKSDEEADFN